MEPRPFAFHKMEALVKQMQDVESGVPVRSQKIFLTSIPSAFMGYDLIGWLMEHLNIEESGEAVHLANQLCQYGYLFPVTDCKSLTVKDDNSLYRFQAAYYWPWHHRNPDNVEYAIYLVKRSQRNKQRHALEEYEQEALNSLKKNLQNKWEIITMQAEEQCVQVKVGKERKKMDKLVADSQERAYWRVHRPPPGCLPPLDPGPFSTLRKSTNPPPHNSQVEILKRQLSKSRVKASQAIDSLVNHCNTYCEYDPFLTPAQPSNPWLSDDHSYWQFNQPIVEVPTDKRVKRWGLSVEDLLADPTGVEEFTNFLRKEYSHENIRFWLAVKDLRGCSQSQVPAKVKSIYEEFLVHGAPCEINIDSKTLEFTLNEMKTPTRFVFDVAAHHVYNVLLNKDCYPRFIRSDHYKNLLATALHPPTKKRFFGFVSGGKKKSCAGVVGSGVAVPTLVGGSSVSRRRGSDRSLTAPGHETLPPSFHHQHAPAVPLSSSQANLHEISSSRESGISPEKITVTGGEAKHVSFETSHPLEDKHTEGNAALLSKQSTLVSFDNPTVPQSSPDTLSNIPSSEHRSNKDKSTKQAISVEITDQPPSAVSLPKKFMPDTSEKSLSKLKSSAESITSESCQETSISDSFTRLNLTGSRLLESQTSESHEGSQISLAGSSSIGSPMKIGSTNNNTSKLGDIDPLVVGPKKDNLRKYSVCSLKEPIENKQNILEIKSEENLTRTEFVQEVKSDSTYVSIEPLSTDSVGGTGSSDIIDTTPTVTKHSLENLSDSQSSSKSFLDKISEKSDSGSPCEKSSPQPNTSREEDKTAGCSKLVQEKSEIHVSQEKIDEATPTKKSTRKSSTDANTGRTVSQKPISDFRSPDVVLVEEIKSKDEKRIRRVEKKSRVMSEEHRSERRKESSVERRHLSMDDEDYGNSPKKASVQSLPDKVLHPSVQLNPTEVCPWEDEESCKTEETFVKKYATLGYL